MSAVAADPNQMTPAQQRRMRILAVISAEADDYPVDKLLPTHSLRRELNLGQMQRIALAYSLEREFALVIPDPCYDAITAPHATVLDVLSHVGHLADHKEGT